MTAEEEPRVLNFPELKRLNLWVQAQSKLEPGTRAWVQGWWVTLREEKPMCRSAYCVAGATIVRAGHKLAIDRDSDFFLLDGKRIGNDYIPQLADEILGLDHRGIYYDDDDLDWIRPHKYDLYVDDNSAEDIDRIIRQIFADHDVSYARTKAAPDRKITSISEPEQEAP